MTIVARVYGDDGPGGMLGDHQRDAGNVDDKQLNDVLKSLSKFGQSDGPAGAQARFLKEINQMITEIKEAIDKQAEAFEAFKTTNDERVEAVRKGNEAKAKELETKLTKIEADVQKFSELKKHLEVVAELKDRLEEIEAKSNTPGKTPAEKRGNEYREHFTNWLRNKGNSPLDEQKLQDVTRQMMEHKDVTVGSPGGGGFALPKEIAAKIENLERLLSPVRRLVSVAQVGTSDYHQLINIRGTTSGWVGETGTRGASNTPQLRDITPTHGELYAYPQASEWSLDDLYFDVETGWPRTSRKNSPIRKVRR